MIVTIAEHAELHRKRFEELGEWQDKVAWLTLSGQINKEEAISMAASLANRGKKHTEEHRRKNSEARKGKKTKPLSEEIKQKLRGPRGPYKKHSENDKISKSLRQLGRKHKCHKSTKHKPHRPHKPYSFWWNNGIKMVQYHEKPGDGWIRGKL